MQLTASELERELNALLGLVHRLMPPLNTRPHAFHEQKDALARGVIDLMERCGFRRSSPTSFCARHSDDGGRVVRAGGREIPVERKCRS